MALEGYYGQPVLVHTRLEVKFDYRRCYLYGREWITLRPHHLKRGWLPTLDKPGGDLYAGGDKQRHRAWLYNKADSFTFRMASRPRLVNFDAERVLVAREKDNNKTVKTAVSNQENKGAQSVILSVLSDKYSGIRSLAILKDRRYLPVFIRALGPGSYKVQGAASKVLPWRLR